MPVYSYFVPGSKWSDCWNIQRVTSAEVAGPRMPRAGEMVRLLWMGSPPVARAQPSEC
jgi:hypothetical protein